MAAVDTKARGIHEVAINGREKQRSDLTPKTRMGYEVGKFAFSPAKKR